MNLFKFQHKNGGTSRFGKLVSVAAVLLIAALAYLTVNPEAHAFIHPDANRADHQCAVTAFAVGEGLYLAPHIEVRPMPIVVQVVHIEAGEDRRESLAHLLPPVCGPPVGCMIA